VPRVGIVAGRWPSFPALAGRAGQARLTRAGHARVTPTGGGGGLQGGGGRSTGNRWRPITRC